MPVNNGPKHEFPLRSRALPARSEALARCLCAGVAGAVAALPIACLGALAPELARADDEEAVVHHVEPPPAPAEHPPTLAVEMRVDAEAPIERSAICPAGVGCVLGLGVGLGVRIEQRSADRIGLFVAYDFWLIDGDAIFELATLHAVRAGVRYVIDDSTMVHPFIEGAIGVLAFGDTASVVALGGLVSAGGGVELELSEAVAFVSTFEAWFLSTAPFQTREGTTRSDPFGVNVALQLTVGVSVLVGPYAAAR